MSFQSSGVERLFIVQELEVFSDTGVEYVLTVQESNGYSESQVSTVFLELGFDSTIFSRV